MSINKNALLVGAAIVGVIATAVCSAKDTINAEQAVQREIRKTTDYSSGEQENLDMKGLVKIVAPRYVRTAVAIGATSFCVIKLHRNGVRTALELTGALAAAVSQKKRIEEEARKVFGDEAVDKIKMEAAKSDIVDDAVKKLYSGDKKGLNKMLATEPVGVEIIDEDGEIFHEGICGGFFKVRRERVAHAQKYVAECIREGKSLSAGEYRDLWYAPVPSAKLRRVKRNSPDIGAAGKILGWCGWPKEESWGKPTMDELKFKNVKYNNDKDFNAPVIYTRWTGIIPVSTFWKEEADLLKKGAKRWK